MVNQVEQYLQNNKTLKLSARTLSKRLNLKVGTVMYLSKMSCKDKNLRIVSPYEVGSGRYKVSVFTCID